MRVDGPGSAVIQAGRGPTKRGAKATALKSLTRLRPATGSGGANAGPIIFRGTRSDSASSPIYEGRSERSAVAFVPRSVTDRHARPKGDATSFIPD